MITTSVINKPLSRVLFSRITNINIEVCIKCTNLHTYFQYFSINDFVYGLNFDKDNFVIVNNYTRLIYQKGILNKKQDYNVEAAIKNENTLLFSDYLRIKLGNDFLSIYRDNTIDFTISTHQKNILADKFIGQSWWTYDIIIAIKEDKIYILIFNQYQ